MSGSVKEDQPGCSTTPIPTRPTRKRRQPHPLFYEDLDSSVATHEPAQIDDDSPVVSDSDMSISDDDDSDW